MFARPERGRTSLPKKRLFCHKDAKTLRNGGFLIPVISTGGPVVSGRSGQIWSRMEVVYGPQPDVSTGLDVTREPIRLKYEIRATSDKRRIRHGLA